ncbi:snapalysin [Streptomyces sp. NPDC096324]|uniref:snapalysin n=1 Tax=Streptomyces sp. NPDC096324 TaxID=3366085 RepID=UPI003826CADE
MKWSNAPVKSSKKSAKSAEKLLAAAIGLGLASAALCTATPASAQTAGPAPSTSAVSPYAGRSGSAESAANNKAFFEAVLKSVATKHALRPNLASVTVYYNASQAPSFRSQISTAASIWNSAVSNVKLQETSGSGDFSYYEGNDWRGSYASTDGHGKGYVFIDYRQTRANDPLRVTAHETGHVLGLPDHYSGPCSELMSGGGPGPSCTNPYPDANEGSRVDRLWANGLAKVMKAMNSKR